MKRLFSLFLCLGMLFSFPACGKEDAARPQAGGIRTGSGELYPTAFLSFDGTDVEFDLFRYYYLNYKNMHLEEDADYFEKEGSQEDLKEEILSVLLDFYAIRFLAEENGVHLTKNDRKLVEEDVKKTVEFYNGKDAFLSYLEQSYMTEELYVYMMEYSSLYLKLFNKLYKDGGKKEWSDEKFYSYYEDNYLAAQQIFLPYKDNGEDKASHPKTAKLAESVHKKAGDGADFWKLIEEYGKDDNMKDYPDGYYFTKGQAEDTLYEATAALKTGEISKPVEGETGLYIIRRMEMKKLRMDENRETTLYGYTDTLGNWNAGVYDNEFQSLYKARAEKIKVNFSSYWDTVSTKTVY